MPREQGRKVVASNRKARHDYTILDTYEAGMALTGTEVKSLRAGRASLTQPADGGMPDSPDLVPLFRTILETIPAPTYTEGAPLQAHVTNLDASPFLGRLALLRIHEGELRKGQTVAWMRRDGTSRTSASPSCW